MIPQFDDYKKKWALTSDDVIKPGLTAIEEALALVGNPERTLQIVHLAGTNGKGSTLTFLESIAQEHGLKVGKFMSPCILNVHDQIQVMQQPISALEMDRVFHQMKNAGLSGKLTDFELLTVAAFLHFVHCDVDIALIEAGMGGLLDSTNVVQPIVSIIPSIALEHTKFLGPTIESIAQHKAGIIKQHRPVVIGDLPCEAKNIIEREANAKQAPVLELNNQFHIVRMHDYENYKNETMDLHITNLTRHMKGPHQANNMALAITAFLEVATALNVAINVASIRQGIEMASILGRFEEVLPYIIFDGAHNPASAEKLVETVRQAFPNESITFVVGILGDKDVKGVLQYLEQISETFYFVDFDNPRAMSAQDMLALCHAPQKAILQNTIPFLQQQSEKKCRTIVTGSLYLLTEVRGSLLDGSGHR
ncbi:bifunctional folylpolyglutamate synthase/dihydrofolate synthase [Lysinibacillus sphaericus]|uniref:tetrahydrofolate synthase n=2 Tax=Lysinibacillus TaxID=400634 RepID=A0A2S0JY31_LYSSH|nr:MULTISPECIES: folylpolyglutamate synthase/dihydrofolate synthase family protein [Lysinibacillus]AHN22733.1 folylpolyglutamate synthase [Lysinibacillus varians]AVK96053.1 bifunctional folylpolyglutamate synthase/dihydrofolate synthase [Lysinibacillus sphaericus]MED4544672.1 bifunctional folylpolyglutamate synthase/dihydrofolate synthase [Lysinibacillus sphaericus]TKI20793.1 bifunctional folylpolyglutamate synthase/dihydrofolate synthase [Lysinibacillus sphaericus]TKI66072.1 bifunctional foly